MHDIQPGCMHSLFQANICIPGFSIIRSCWLKAHSVSVDLFDRCIISWGSEPCSRNGQRQVICGDHRVCGCSPRDGTAAGGTRSPNWRRLHGMSKRCNARTRCAAVPSRPCLGARSCTLRRTTSVLMCASAITTRRSRFAAQPLGELRSGAT